MLSEIGLNSEIVDSNNSHFWVRIKMNDGEIFQERRDDLVIDDYIEISNEVVDEENFVQAFILDEGPLFRFKIFENTTLLADFHHIILDGTSLKILFDEIARIYDQRDYQIEEINGFEYSLNESKIEKSNLYKEAELFFFDKIKEFEEATFISPDLNGQKDDGISLEKYSYLNKSKINKFCDEHKINPNNLFLAVTSFVLSKFVYNKNLLIATLSNGRYTKAQEMTLAMMVKTLPLALKLDTELSINDYLSYINEEWLNVLTYSSYPLTKISTDFGITPEFLYTYQGKINGFYATSFEEAFILTNYDNEIVNDLLKELKPGIYKNIVEEEEKFEKNKENSYKWQVKLEKCKGEFASKLLYKLVNEESKEKIPELPKYISDGLAWIEGRLGER